MKYEKGWPVFINRSFYGFSSFSAEHVGPGPVLARTTRIRSGSAAYWKSDPDGIEDLDPLKYWVDVPRLDCGHLMEAISITTESGFEAQVAEEFGVVTSLDEVARLQEEIEELKAALSDAHWSLEIIRR